MNNENKPNANASAATSPTGPGKPQPQQPPKPEDRVDKKVTEADYITRQADEARAAISAVVGDMKKALAESANIKEWTRQYPWVVAGAATVAGFVTGMIVTPSKDETLRDKWESLKDKFTPDLNAPQPSSATARTIADQPQAESPSILAVVMREVLKAVGPTIGGLITGALAGQQAAPDDDHGGNGHHRTSDRYTATEPPGGAPQG
jgi:hypothetical protein